MKTCLVTGGCGFIGANFVRRIIDKRPNWKIINLDALTYAGNYGSASDLDSDRHQFIHGDIRDEALLKAVFSENKLSTVVHLAAESHVDRSIIGSAAFVETNVTGTFKLLQRSLEFWNKENRKR